jgi:hypothetical protein
MKGDCMIRRFFRQKFLKLLVIYLFSGIIAFADEDWDLAKLDTARKAEYLTSAEKEKISRL